jgi:hypothetical protein
MQYEKWLDFCVKRIIDNIKLKIKVLQKLDIQNY